jgi:transposase-like protein
MYVVEVSAATISALTEKILPMVEGWQNRPLAACYVMLYLDAIFIKLRREGKVETVPVYNSAQRAPGVDLEEQRDILGHWIEMVYCSPGSAHSQIVRVPNTPYFLGLG